MKTDWGLQFCNSSMKNNAAALTTQGLHRHNYDFTVKTGISCGEHWTLQQQKPPCLKEAFSVSITPESISEKSTSMLIMRHPGPAQGAPRAWHWGCPCAASPWLSPQLSNCLCQCYQPPKVAVCLRFQEGNLLPWRAWLLSPHPSTSPGYLVYVSIIISHGECQ